MYMEVDLDLDTEAVEAADNFPMAHCSHYIHYCSPQYYRTRRSVLVYATH
jgi:hypothetical protein